VRRESTRLISFCADMACAERHGVTGSLKIEMMEAWGRRMLRLEPQPFLRPER